MDRFIQGQDMAEGRDISMQVVEEVSLEGRPLLSRQDMPRRDAGERMPGYDEVQLGYTADLSKWEAERCLACGLCSECYQCVDACLAQAVNHDMQPTERLITVGAVILAPGFIPYDPRQYEQYGYAAHPNVVTSLEFERMLSASGPYAGHLVRPSDGKEPERIAWLQCVGSRDINHCDNGYCSSVCCMYANKQAVIAKEHAGSKPLEATIFFMDMRTFGKDFDKYNLRAEDEHGVRFVSFAYPFHLSRARRQPAYHLCHRGRHNGRRAIRHGRPFHRPDA